VLFLINLNKYKETILKFAKPYIHREIDFADIKLTLLNGLGAEIRGLKIIEKPEWRAGNFVYIEKLRIKLKLLPLLSKSLQAKELILDKPIIHVVRNSEGTFNYSDIMETSGKKTSTKINTENSKHSTDNRKRTKDTSSKNNNKEEKAQTQLAGLKVSKFEINDGKIHFLDHYNGDAPQKITLDSLNAEIKNVSLDEMIRLRLMGHIPGEKANQTLQIEGLLGPIGTHFDVSTLFMDIRFTLDDVLLFEWKPYLPKDLIAYPVDGSARIDLRLKGTANTGIETDGEISFNNLVLGMKDSGEELKMEGHITIRNSLEGTFDDTTARLQITCPEFTFQLPSSEKHDHSKTSAKNSVESIDIEILSKKKNSALSGNGKVRIKNGIIRNIPFADMNGKFDYQNNIFKIQDLNAQAFQGDIKTTGNIDLNISQWSAETEINRIKIEEVLDNLSQYQGLCKGIFNGSILLQGEGSIGEQNSFTSSGAFNLSEGEIRNINLLGTVLDSLFGLKGIARYIDKNTERYDEYKVTRFENLVGDFSISENRVNVKKLNLLNIHAAGFSGSDAKLTGTIKIDTDILNLKGRIFLSREYSDKLTKKVKPLQALLNEKGRIVLPIVITGSINQPKPNLDTNYVLNAMVKHYGTKEIQKGLEKLGEKLQQFLSDD